MNEQPPLFTMPQAGLTTDDYYTPKWIFDALNLVFDLDVASPPNGPTFTPCKAYYTQNDDGLTSAWYGTVWMNPPYSKPAPWVEKFINHSNGIALLPFAKSKWCESLWNSTARMIYIRAVSFIRSEMDVTNQAPFSLGLWGMGEQAIKALHDSKLGKVR